MKCSTGRRACIAWNFSIAFSGVQICRMPLRLKSSRPIGFSPGSSMPIALSSFSQAP